MTAQAQSGTAAPKAWAQELWSRITAKVSADKQKVVDVLPSIDDVKAAMEAVVATSPPRNRLGDFELDVSSVLGEGGYARVVLGRNRKSGERVAVKLLSGSAVDGRAAVSEAAVVREVGALRRAGVHPNVCQLHGHFPRDDGDHAVVLEACMGGELFALVERGGALPEPQVRALTVGIVAGLAHLHEAGIAHRDLKLENILLGGPRNDVPKICDLGLAHVHPIHARGADGRWASEPLTQFCGSRSYCPPEVMARRPYDGFLADLWSLAVCIFGMASGFFPVDEATARDWRFERLARLQLSHPTRSTTHEVYGFYQRQCPLSPALVQLLDACVQIRPARRLPLAHIAAAPWLAGETQATPPAHAAAAPVAVAAAAAAAATDITDAVAPLAELDATETVYRSRSYIEATDETCFCSRSCAADGVPPPHAAAPPTLRRQRAAADVAQGWAEDAAEWPV